MNFFSKLMLFGCLISPFLLRSLEVSEDEYYIYTRRGWSDIADSRQLDLMRYFNAKLQSQLVDKDISTNWTANTEKVFLGSHTQFTAIIDDLRSRANSTALEQSISFSDLIPTGFIVGFGVKGSGSYVVGMGGSILLTLTVVPVQVERFDKSTGKLDIYYLVSWAIGGIGQVGAGLGEGANMTFQGAIGIVWGDLPNASALTGPGIGFSASLASIYGLGLKAAFVYNTTTQHHNLVTLATYEAGVGQGTSIDASGFYFMNIAEVVKYLFHQTPFVSMGKEMINEINLGS